MKTLLLVLTHSGLLILAWTAAPVVALGAVSLVVEWVERKNDGNGSR